MKKMIKTLLNTRIGTILLLEAFKVILYRCLDKAIESSERTSYAKLIARVDSDIEDLKNGMPFEPIFK